MSRKSKEAVISAIKDLKKNKEDLSRSPSIQFPQLYPSAVYYFGSWDKATEAAGCPTWQRKRRNKWSKDVIIERILKRKRKRKSLNPKAVFNDKAGELLYAAAKTYFGSWSAALEAAGESPDDHYERHLYGEGEVGEGLRKWACANGGALSDTPLCKENRSLYSAAIREYGNIRKAAGKLGLRYQAVFQQDSKQVVIFKILERARAGKDMDFRSVKVDDPDLAKSARGRFNGSWSKATKAAAIHGKQFQKTVWSKELIGKELHAYIKTHGSPLTHGGISENNYRLQRAATKHFGSLKKAANYFGIEYFDRRKSPRKTLVWSMERIEGDLKVHAKQFGSLCHKDLDIKLYSAVRRKFGTLERAANHLELPYVGKQKEKT